MDYEKQALQSKIYDSHVGKSYVTIGLFGELSEWLEKVFADDVNDSADQEVGIDGVERYDQQRSDDIYKELGDVLWYLAGIRHEFQLELSGGRDINEVKMSSFIDLLKRDMPTEINEDTLSELSFKYFMDLVISCGKICEYHKKEIRDGSIKTAQITEAWEKSMANLDACLVLAHSSNLEELANANSQKLFSRLERGVIGGEGDNR